VPGAGHLLAVDHARTPAVVHYGQGKRCPIDSFFSTLFICGIFNNR
jgi:hypothetical protein